MKENASGCFFLNTVECHCSSRFRIVWRGMV